MKELDPKFNYLPSEDDPSDNTDDSDDEASEFLIKAKKIPNTDANSTQSRNWASWLLLSLVEVGHQLFKSMTYL